MANWASQWKAAKTAFEAKTGQKKASAATMNSIRKGSGLEDALKTCDTEFAAIGAEKDAAKKQALIQKFDMAVKAFEAKDFAYQKTLVAAIVQADSKLLQPELTLLWKQLNALRASMKKEVTTLTVAAHVAKGQALIAKNLLISLTGAVTKAKAFAAKVTSATGAAGPTTFNAGIVPASKAITAHAVHIEKLKAKGYVFEQGDPTNLSNLFKIMAPWAQNQRKLAATATPPLVKREVGAFLQVVAGFEKWAKG
jgi:hypothetical protein